MRNIFIVGFMGCGKSYAGRRLAEIMGMDFLDMDREIEEAAGKPITALFEEFGEEHFRQLERDFLENLDVKETVISTGGGAPCFFDNMDVMKSKGVVIFLDIALDTILERLKRKPEKRPLVKALNDRELRTFVSDKLAERRPFYEQADIKAPYSEPEKLKKLLEGKDSLQIR